jgi:LysR family transcriptional regulator for bpeEF and oprC
LGFSKDDVRVQAALRGHVALEDENSYVAAAEAGLGIAQIPAFVLKEAMERGSLELVLGDWFPEPLPLYVVYPQHRHLSGKVRVFVDWVAQLLGDHDGIQRRSTLRPSRTEAEGR